MCVYLRVKFQVFSVILRSFRHRKGGERVIPPPLPQIVPLRSPHRLGLMTLQSSGKSTSGQLLLKSISTFQCRGGYDLDCIIMHCVKFGQIRSFYRVFYGVCCLEERNCGVCSSQKRKRFYISIDYADKIFF